MRQRAALLAPGHNTNRPYNVPEIGKNIAYQANRDGVAERVADPAGQKNLAVDLALVTYDDQRLTDLERSIVKAATHHDAHTLSLWPTVPGIGTILRLVWRDDIHHIERVPRVQDVVSSCRLVTCAKESAGKRLGPAGKNIGNAHLKWACSEAAALVLRNKQAGQKYLARLEQKPDTGKALTLLAHQRARAVYDRLKRQTAFAMDKFLHG
jgi:transposase